MAGAGSVGPSLASRLQTALGDAARVGVAVSGGGDSMALLDAVAGFAATRDLSCRAVTVDHGLRAEAADEAALVARACAAYDVPHEVLRWTWDGQGNLQAAARDARYRLMADWAVGHGLDAVLLGHNEDDVAESLLLRLRRSPGVDGLAEMPRRFSRDGVIFLRPFLDISRADLRAHLTERGIEWAEDPSNDDPAYDRVRARQLMSALEPLGAGPAALAATARHLRAASAALDAAARDAALRVAHEDRGDIVLTGLDRLADEIARRVLLRALAHVSGRSGPPRQTALDGLFDALEHGRVHALHGCLVARDDHGIRIAREPAAVADLAAPTTELWDGRWQLDGPHDSAFEIRALGEAVATCPWRETGLPRASLTASPAVWEGEVLVAAPLAGLERGWRATATGRGKFTAPDERD